MKKDEQEQESPSLAEVKKKAEAFLKQSGNKDILITSDKNLFLPTQKSKAMAWAAKNKAALYLATKNEKGEVSLKPQLP